MFPWLAHGHILPYLELSKRLLIRKNFYIYLCSTPINFTSINTFIHNNNLSESIEVTAKSSFSDIITTLKPDLVIFDIFQPWAARLASSQGIPAVHFAPLGAATMSYCYHHYVRRHPDGDFPFQELRFGDDNEKKSLDGLFQFMYYNVFEEDEDVVFVNYRKLLPVGPLVADVNKDDDDEEKYSDMMEWLSKKNQHSTVYISFGSEYFLSKPEIEEIAKGLELSDTNFIWVIRFPLGEEISVEDALPKGFLERVKERGVVVSGWAPQARILAHQNCRMLVEAGACVEVERDENGVYKGEEIAKAIRKVVVESSGEGLRQRAQELSEKMKMEEGQELDEVAESLWQLCLKSKD
ncbi:UNVERIFIED_CONTAM: Beta-D-glucosyl crocetin beta-1,6-glucosyltransferase [Sesamum calycinum]|uniref:Beta-D-glucosyl crocetin beta-1,6-glucosyltransferase n=1 Tax=Sesamum calycinum TaxID=2727403 RepID=A0AAW2QKP5_9LAMI